MKKKLLATVLCIVMVATMASCGKKEEAKPESVKKETQATEAVKEDTESVYEVEQPETTEATETEADTEDDEVVPGNSKSNAYLLPLNTKVFGTVKADEYAWFSFKTGDDPNATYNATFVNDSPESEFIEGTLMDEYGTKIDSDHHQANNYGAPVTITSDNLEPNTTYYMQIQPTNGYDYDYSLIIKNTSDTSSAYKTIGNVSDAIRNTAQDGDTVESGTNTNINDAVEVPLGAGVHGTVKDGEAAWLSFTTGDQAGATYNATFVNDSPKSEFIEGILMDEYGTKVDSNHHQASNDGAPVTITSNELEPNTTYYLQLISTNGYDYDYSVTFKSPDAVAKQSDLIFETPFEINDTQIQFVAESDKFIDEAEVKEVLKPVAEAILKHPDSSVLLAGTTATDGDQADRVKLSNRRAEAVKKLLVSAYKVPESQLKTVGLGFEADPFERGQDRDSSGNFVESEGRKNRRVVVMDAKDPIAQQILGQ